MWVCVGGEGHVWGGEGRVCGCVLGVVRDVCVGDPEEEFNKAPKLI